MQITKAEHRSVIGESVQSWLKLNKSKSIATLAAQCSVTTLSGSNKQFSFIVVATWKFFIRSALSIDQRRRSEMGNYRFEITNTYPCFKAEDVREPFRISIKTAVCSFGSSSMLSCSTTFSRETSLLKPAASEPFRLIVVS